MNLYLISQKLNNDYDTYDSCVVAAESAADARTISPSTFVTHITGNNWMGTYAGGIHKEQEYIIDGRDWVAYTDIDKIKVEYLGKTEKERGVILASYNAG